MSRNQGCVYVCMYVCRARVYRDPPMRSVSTLSFGAADKRIRELQRRSERQESTRTSLVFGRFDAEASVAVDM